MPLKQLIEEYKELTLKDDVAIFQLMTPTSKGQFYAIVSVSDEADKIIEEYGAISSSENDYAICELKNYTKDPLFGNKILTVFLK